MAKTSLTFGTVTAPGQRYHPAVIAQGVATLEEMFPSRFWIAAGSGQFLNEGITGQGWPAKDLRNRRLLECVDVMRALWRGETVTHRGLLTVEEAKLYTRPKTMPLVFCAALTKQTAAWAGSWADGQLTGGSSPDSLKELIQKYREGGGKGSIYVQPTVLIARDAEEGARIAYENWKMNILGAELQADIRTPAQFDAASKFVRPTDLLQSVHISADPLEHVGWIHGLLDAGADRIYLNCVGCNLSETVEFFATKVLQQF